MAFDASGIWGEQEALNADEEFLDKVLLEDVDEYLGKSISPLNRKSQPRPYRNYVDYVEYLATEHRYLECLSGFLKHRKPDSREHDGYQFSTSPHTRQLMKIMDIEKTPQSTLRIDQNVLLRGDYGEEGSLERLLREPPSSLQTRIIVIRTVTPETINLLGEIFDIDPEFFYGHLEPQNWTPGATPKIPHDMVTQSNRFSKKRFFHLDFEKLQMIEIYDRKFRRSLTVERRTALLKDFVDRLSERIAATMNIVPKMKLLHTNGLTLVEWPSFVCRNRISFFSCNYRGVETNIYLLYPEVAARKYEAPAASVPYGTNARTTYSLSLQSRPKIPIYSAGRPADALPRSSANLSHRLLFSLLNQYRSTVKENSNSPVIPTLAIFSLASSEWIVTLAHIDRLIGCFEDDVNLLVPTKGNEHCISLAGTRKILFEHLELILDTLRMLRKEPSYRGAATKPAVIEDMIEEFENHLDLVKRLIERADRALATHSGFMAIEESRKAIAQTEQVRRLTNLAFIFLPLTLTTSIFGMNVYELGPDSHLWIVLATGVIVTILSVTTAIHWDYVIWFLFAGWYSLQWPVVMFWRAWWLEMDARRAAKEAKRVEREGEGEAKLETRPFRFAVMGLREFLHEKGCYLRTN